METGEIGVGNNEGRITSLGFQIDSLCDSGYPPPRQVPGRIPTRSREFVHVDVCKGGRLCSSQGLTQEMETSVVEAQWS